MNRLTSICIRNGDYTLYLCEEYRNDLAPYAIAGISIKGGINSELIELTKEDIDIIDEKERHLSLRSSNTDNQTMIKLTKLKGCPPAAKLVAIQFMDDA